MLKLRSFLIYFILFSSIIFVQAQQKKLLTLKDIFGSNKLQTKVVENIQWQPDGSAFTFTKENSKTGFEDIYKMEVKSGKANLLLEGASLKYNDEPIRMSHYEWTQKGKYLLIEGPEKTIWRHSRQAPFYLYDVSSKKVIALAKHDIHLRNVKLSPDGKRVGFVRDHNIYVVNLSNDKEIQITHDGSDNILNGEFDWVYEEEFGLADAWRWSPDSKKIAFWRLDQTRVGVYHLVDDLAGQYNSVFNLKYPKVGTKNSIVKIGVADINSGKTTWMDIGKNDDIYIPRIYWTNSSNELAMLRLNRPQNYLEMLLANASTGKSKTIITDSDPDWVDIQDDIQFLKHKDEIIWTSEKSGYRHIYLYDYNGKLIHQLTRGNWEVSAVAGVSEESNYVYFYGKKDSPLQQNIYRVKLDGTGFEKISSQSGWHDADFSPDMKYYIDFFSDVKTPTQTILRNADGSLIRVLEKDHIKALDNYHMVYPEFLTVKTNDGTKLNAYMIKPYNFDPDKKYPVLVYGYGGPSSQMVVDRWGGSRTLFHQYMTEQGYIVFCLDNRGTGGRGKTFKNLAFHDLGKWSVHDQIEGAKYLASLSYVDAKRLGFWGWSGGGYLTLMMMTKGAGYFKAGVAVAPVSDFKFYDTIWTERYMGTPADNAKGFKSASVLTYADRLKGKLLIIHGSTDDNVHFQNTLAIADKFQEDLKQFDLMVYPNRNHSISGGNTQLHLFTKISDYFETNL